MKSQNLTKAEELEQRIAGCTMEQRIALQPEFSELLNRMTAEGETAPLRLKRLEASLSDEAVEARFDNMPV
ncbi:hypothetical protein [Falsiphaeobacter marinintestinus]|uniref:hypothetical protein n=1 Tax=Falsiphaeobacter marinintestinus TaxID=1492905 RepID=UPI0011B49501|nr:hypothetical protein [Phaeobacter marinintestinus]